MIRSANVQNNVHTHIERHQGAVVRDRSGTPLGTGIRPEDANGGRNFARVSLASFVKGEI